MKVHNHMSNSVSVSLLFGTNIEYKNITQQDLFSCESYKSNTKWSEDISATLLKKIHNAMGQLYNMNA